MMRRLMSNLLVGAITVLFGCLISVGILTTYYCFFGEDWEFCRLDHKTLVCEAQSEKARIEISRRIWPEPTGIISCSKGHPSISNVDFDDARVLSVVVDSLRDACGAIAE